MVECFLIKQEVEMKKLVLLTSAIACISQGIAQEKLLVNAGDLLNDRYKNNIKMTMRTAQYLATPSNWKFATLSTKEQKVAQVCLRYRATKEFSKYVKM